MTTDSKSFKTALLVLLVAACAATTSGATCLLDQMAHAPRVSSSTAFFRWQCENTQTAVQVEIFEGDTLVVNEHAPGPKHTVKGLKPHTTYRWFITGFDGTAAGTFTTKDARAAGFAQSMSAKNIPLRGG